MKDDRIGQRALIHILILLPCPIPCPAHTISVKQGLAGSGKIRNRRKRVSTARTFNEHLYPAKPSSNVHHSNRKHPFRHDTTKSFCLTILLCSESSFYGSLRHGEKYGCHKAARA